MQTDMISIFVNAALAVLRQELGDGASAGGVKVQSSAQTSEEVTVMIGLSGDVRGMVLMGMSIATALAIVSQMMGETWPAFDEMAQSGIAEMVNVITGSATQGLEAAGYTTNITPPALVAGGPGIIISTVNIRRFVVPIHTPLGPFVLHTALELAPELRNRVDAQAVAA